MKKTLAWLAAIACLLVAAALAARPAARVALARLSPRIEARLTQALGTEVKLGPIEPRFDLFRPVFDVSQAEVPGATARGLRISLSFWKSLAEMRPVAGAIRVDELELSGLALPLGSSPGSPGAQLDEMVFSVGKARIEGETGIELEGLTYRRGTLSVDSARITDARLWQKPISVRDLSARLKRDGAAWELDNLAVDLEGIALSAEARYEPSSPVARLQAKLAMDQGDLVALRPLIPLPVLSPGLRSWLALSLKKGRMKRLELAFDGDPAAPARAKLSLSLPFENAALDYRERWPALEGAQGSLKIEGRKAAFEISQAELAGAPGARIRKLQGAIPSFDAPDLQVTGELEAAPEAVTKLLGTGPFPELGKTALAYVAPTQKLELLFRAGHLLADSMDVSLAIRSGGMKVLKTGQEISKIHGSLDLSDRKASFDELVGLLGGKELRLTGSYVPASGKTPGRTELEAWVEAPLAELRPWAPEAAKKILGAGEARFHAKLSVHPADETAPPSGEAAFDADLSPAEALAPAPLGKAAGEPSQAKGTLAFRGDSLTRLDAHLARGKQQLDVKLTPGPERQKVSLSGETGPIDARAWRDWLRGLPADTGPARDFELSVKTPALSWDDLRFTDARLEAARTGDAWTGSIRSKEAYGDLSAQSPITTHTLQARFKYLTFPDFKPASDPDAIPEGWDLRDWPSLDLKFDELSLGEKKYGKVRVSAHQVREGGDKPKKMVFDEVEMSGPRFDLSLGRADCVYDGDEPSAFHTHASGVWTLKSYNFEFKRAKSVSSVDVTGGKIRFKGGFQGAPNQFVVRRFEGDIYGTLRQGQFNGVKSMGQAIINTMSMSQADSRKHIVRFYKGSFQAKVEKGIWDMIFAKGLVGSVFARLWGKTDLEKKTLDMQIRFVPHVEDIPDGEELLAAGNDLDSEEDPSYPVTPRFKIPGTWDDPSPSLQVF